ncbi:Protein of unknown function [Pyronema omphalodes CBS 100304]|uniref:Uncharacterized protein n=1 Tax=Pyronema omphalodes (strain CBS 100304) TaxID=1076935 RepID=U4LAL2_PYROM|nr:Protein of unknown function [Pyronema omphalodes CBS 100304]
MALRKNAYIAQGKSTTEQGEEITMKMRRNNFSSSIMTILTFNIPTSNVLTSNDPKSNTLTANPV